MASSVEVDARMLVEGWTGPQDHSSQEEPEVAYEERIAVLEDALEVVGKDQVSS